ncbi:MAG: tetratricopeptide repeat protein, partial [Pseudomonadota bacterium]
SGNGVERDFVQAREWFLKAAEQGDPASQTFLAQIYREGLGVERDLVTAHMWYDLAYRHGHRRMLRHMNNLQGEMSAEELREARDRVVQWLQRRDTQPVNE